MERKLPTIALELSFIVSQLRGQSNDLVWLDFFQTFISLALATSLILIAHHFRMKRNEKKRKETPLILIAQHHFRMKRKEEKRNETKRNETKQNKTKETKQNKRNTTNIDRVAPFSDEDVDDFEGCVCATGNCVDCVGKIRN